MTIASEAEPEAGAAADRGEGIAAVPGEVFRFQLTALLIGDFQRFLGTSRAHTQVCRLLWTYATNFSLRTLAVVRKKENSSLSGLLHQAIFMM
jgi:hypothetical protein